MRSAGSNLGKLEQNIGSLQARIRYEEERGRGDGPRAQQLRGYLAAQQQEYDQTRQAYESRGVDYQDAVKAAPKNYRTDLANAGNYAGGQAMPNRVNSIYDSSRRQQRQVYAADQYGNQTLVATTTSYRPTGYTGVKGSPNDPRNRVIRIREVSEVEQVARSQQRNASVGTPVASGMDGSIIYSGAVSVREKTFKPQYYSFGQDGQLDSNRSVGNSNISSGSYNYSDVRRSSSGEYSSNLVSVPRSQMGVPKIQGTLSQAPSQKKYLGFIPTSEALYEGVRNNEGPSKGFYYLGSTAVSVGEGVVETGKGAYSLVTSPIKTTKEFAVNTYRAVTRPKETVQAVGKNINENPAKFVGRVGADYLTGRAIASVPSAARNVYVRVGSSKVDLAKVTTPEVISGKATFPTASSASESLRAFQSSRDLRTGEYVVSSATDAVLKNPRGVPFTGEFVARRGGRTVDPKLSAQTSGTSGSLARETEGLYVTPADRTSIYFTRVASNSPSEYSLLPNPKNLFNAPKIVRARATGVERVPASLIAQEGKSFTQTNKYILDQQGTGKVFITPRSEKGYLGMAKQTTEIEAVFPVGTQFKKIAPSTRVGKIKGFDEYTVINGKAVPLIDYRAVVTKSSGSLSAGEFGTASARAARSTSSYVAGSSKSIVGSGARYGAGSALRGSSASYPKSYPVKYYPTYTPQSSMSVYPGGGSSAPRVTSSSPPPVTPSYRPPTGSSYKPAGSSSIIAPSYRPPSSSYRPPFVTTDYRLPPLRVDVPYGVPPRLPTSSPNGNAASSASRHKGGERGYTPSLYGIAAGVKGKASAGAIKTGLGVRGVVTPRKKRKSAVVGATGGFS